MEGIRTGGSLAKRNDGQEGLVFRRGCHGWDLESRSTDEEEAHVGAHVQEQVKNGRLRICSTKYPVNISQRISTSSAQRLIFQR